MKVRLHFAINIYQQLLTMGTSHQGFKPWHIRDYSSSCRYVTLYICALLPKDRFQIAL